MADLPDFAPALLAIIRDAHADRSLELTEVVRLSGGASRETWMVGVSGGHADLILQRSRGTTPGERTGAAGMGAEGDLIRAMERQGVPVASVVAASSTAEPLGVPFLLMQRVEGETIPRPILRDDEWAGARAAFVVDAARALAAIHALPLTEVPDSIPAEDPLRQNRALLDALGHPHPVFELALRWLADRAPVASRRTVVHGDFRLGNLLVGPDGLRAVLDWELTHIGDPVEDLGWLCARAWRFGSAPEVAGIGEVDELLAAYSDASGVAVSVEELRWWEVLATLRWGVICIMQAVTHLAGMSRSVELAAIGRRVCETEWDLLGLMGAELPALDEAGAQREPTPPHDRPTAWELVEAVREYLEQDVLPSATGRVRFHARVAAKALAIVERELVLGPAQAEAERERLAALGVADDAELADAIKDGRFDGREPELLASLAETVADKLAVANPGYA